MGPGINGFLMTLGVGVYFKSYLENEILVYVDPQCPLLQEAFVVKKKANT